jgi:threonine/homoserine/homoserine lactone efflux protein
VFGTHDLWLFVVSGLLLNVTPGPDTLYIVGRSSTQGGRAGAVAALGIGAGTLVHILAASLGLSAILAASATAFLAVKMIGAVYLVYVGVSLIRASSVRPASVQAPARRAPLRKVFLQGFLTNVLNPKVALFFLAFLPQFVSGDTPSKALALLFLGAIFDFNGTLWNLAVAWSTARLAGRITGGMGDSARGASARGASARGASARGASARGALFKTWFDRAVGSLFVGVGLKLILSRDR